MKATNVPVNRENFLDLAFMGNPPKELSAEQEMDLPPALRKQERQKAER
jgi:hypothetical protein